ncbi:bifunctional 4-hydroxy-2-oxoglutarate aldolase/2-dehydro-3-deoxy-phosphogluconate aldolase [Oceanimonas pelagia]|uniref:2-dehydro-3-deoxy-phosphogluconate aldolase n=1 Tax=Oceanimonas pelagia TaxID=3028314 RepID=A0AA50KQS5_9GAMM|nr:bifunctional 4-hydroxy-2-oxoglutarate aldolase/2-dehydro-3-deoxy-phosphogluconate aldolase [Oceanimonas pelagia]WMC12013.1 bifunctional 4-hydroxy-2-oxoglutarate aldolase/2-dehydro-3-deoxy-phosphogluconate aldolase [Oceanimonas pelagia]
MRSLTERMAQLKILPVITLDQAEDILPLGRLLHDSGLPAAEITFRSAAAAEAIRLLRRAHPAMLIGAGTVLNREQVQAAKQAGADFVVAPGFNPTTARACRERDMPLIPGVNNPSTIEAALEMGLTTLKFFPAEASGGVNMLRALQGPFGRLDFLPTGGINAGNIRDYLALPGVIACGGSWMVDKALVNAGNWEEIGRLTREAVALVR